LAKAKITVSIDAGLLVDSAQVFDVINIVGILTKEIAGIIGAYIHPFPLFEFP